mgnify:FL=1
MEDVKLDVALVFDDWRGPVGIAIDGETNIRLSSGSLHSGSTFRARITVDPDTAEDLMVALDAGYQPVFRMGKRKVTNTHGVGKLVAVSERPPMIVEDDEPEQNKEGAVKQEIQFEGCTVCVVTPEDLEEYEADRSRLDWLESATMAQTKSIFHSLRSMAVRTSIDIAARG